MTKPINKEIFVFFVALLLASLIYSKFLLSISMISLILFGLMNIEWKPLKIGLKPDLGSHLKDFIKTPTYSLLALTVLAYLITGLYSSDLSEWFWRVRTKAPFIFVPLAFFLAPKLSKKTYENIWQLFVGIATLSMLIVLTNYFLNKEAMVELLRVGKTIPTPCNHIRYSLIIAFASVMSLHQILNSQVRKVLLLVAFLILVAGLHILAVRSGIIAFYFSLFTYIILQLRGMKRWIGGGIALFAFVLLPFIAYHTSASFKQKIDYVKYDWEQYQKGEGSTYSDSERWISLKAGWSLIKLNPILGVGVGDLKPEIKNELDKLGVKVNRLKFPHNQYLFVLASCGLIGGVIFFFGFLGPLYSFRPGNTPLLYSFYMLILLSFTVENTIENAVGTALCIGLISLLVKERVDQEK